MFANLVEDQVRQAKAERIMVLRARVKAWLRYRRSPGWWQVPSMRWSFDPLERFLNLSSPGRTRSYFPARRTGMTAGKNRWRTRKER